ncbi:hypothetical protein PHLGIDRAFT_76213, partial [Phlebiopsis gigantea 11061_1 CR5-6]
LRRPPPPSNAVGGEGPTMANARLAELVVRFLRLSALVAIELGREATEDRAGIEPLEILLCVGLGLPPRAGSTSPRKDKNGGGSQSGVKVDDPFMEFDPDDLPDLEDAVKVLFPSLRDINPLRGGVPPRRNEGAEQEYEVEMTERLTRFYDVPHSTPDVATHMEDLAWQYPAEAVERAACRFCEAVSRWRGKPELETASWIIGNKDAKSSMSIESLVHSNPTSPSRPGTEPVSHLPPLPPYQPPNPQTSRKPSVEDYFSVPPSLLLQSRKRRRSEAERPDDGRRMYQMFT